MRPEPWFMLSPSILSLASYWILAIWGIPHLSRAYPYSRRPRFSALIDLLFLVGLFVFLSDLFWCVAVLARWVPCFPEETLNVLMYIGRDAAGVAFCFLLTKHLFDFGIVYFKSWFFLALALDVGFKLLWFFLAPSPAWTDYTFAWKNDFSMDIVMGSFVISHFLGRITFALTYLGVWNYSYLRRIRKR